MLQLLLINYYYCITKEKDANLYALAKQGRFF